jgi:hypothetical protein
MDIRTELHNLKRMVLSESHISETTKEKIANRIFEIEKSVAINYTHCCKSDSEQLKDEEIPKIDDWIKDLGYTQITFSFVYKNGGTYKDREQLCKEYKKEFCL